MAFSHFGAYLDVFPNPFQDIVDTTESQAESCTNEPIAIEDLPVVRLYNLQYSFTIIECIAYHRYGEYTIYEYCSYPL